MFTCLCQNGTKVNMKKKKKEEKEKLSISTPACNLNLGFLVTVPLTFGAGSLFGMGEPPVPCTIFSINPGHYPTDTSSNQKSLQMLTNVSWGSKLRTELRTPAPLKPVEGLGTLPKSKGTGRIVPSGGLAPDLCSFVLTENPINEIVSLILQKEIFLCAFEFCWKDGAHTCHSWGVGVFAYETVWCFEMGNRVTGIETRVPGCAEAGSDRATDGCDSTLCHRESYISSKRTWSRWETSEISGLLAVNLPSSFPPIPHSQLVERS